MRNNVLVAPSWIADTLARQGHPIKTLIDFPKMRTIFSMSDLFAFLACQKLARVHVFGSLDVVSDVLGVLYAWSNSCQDKADKEYFKRNIEPFAGDEKYEELVKDNLFLDKNVLPNVKKEPYRVVPIEDSHLVVIIQPGVFSATQGFKHRPGLIRSILKQLYVYEDETDVAASSWMRSHLQFLSEAV